jgi:hypothetical protein
MSAQAPGFHRQVVDDVIKNIREDFINEGVDEQVLEDLRQLWESKLMQTGMYDALPGLATHNFNYELNNYNYLDHSNSAALPLAQNPLYNMNPYLTTPNAAQRGQAHNTALNNLRTLNQPNTLPSTTTTSTYYDPTGKPQPYLAPPSNLQSWNTQPTLNTGLNTQFNPPNIRQQDGASDEVDPLTERQKIDTILLKKFAKVQKQKRLIEKLSKLQKTATNSSDSTQDIVPQFDGLSDKKGGEEDDEGDEESGSAKGDEELGSDLDDEEDDEEPDTDDFVLCQYEKVTRVKNKRKANLKDGIMHINGKDYVFSKATGEFDW